MKTIKLHAPLKSGEKEITEIELRKPMAGELRGVKLLDVMMMDVSATATLLPRISTPALTDHMINQLDPADLLSLASEVQGFFVVSDSPQM
jgi:hypothetical protein